MEDLAEFILKAENNSEFYVINSQHEGSSTLTLDFEFTQSDNSTSDSIMDSFDEYLEANSSKSMLTIKIDDTIFINDDLTERIARSIKTLVSKGISIVVIMSTDNIMHRHFRKAQEILPSDNIFEGEQ